MEEGVYGENSEQVATTLNCIGTIQSLQNDYKAAMDSHREALRVLKICLDEELQGNPLVSQTLCQIGAVYYRERNSLSTIKAKKDDYTTFFDAGMLEVIGLAHEERELVVSVLGQAVFHARGFGRFRVGHGRGSFRASDVKP